MVSAVEVEHVSTKQEQPFQKPLQLSGILNDTHKNFPLTPSIGQEFPQASIQELLTAPNSDALLRDLAITVSQRGVVFFRNQNSLTIAQQKELAQRLGELSGKPESSKLHIHPLHNSEREHGADDDEVSVISSEEAKKYLQNALGQRYGLEKKKSLAPQWHTDISFEPVPSDYAILQMHTIPPVGGDTLWASTYDIYDRLGSKYAQFLESLTGHFQAPGFQKAADENGFSLYKGPRGSPKNAEQVLQADHPLVRTNPVTGWKAVYAHTAASIPGLTDDETKNLKSYLLQLVLENHDTTVRWRWGPKDVAIWDNRSTLHAATPDFDVTAYDRTGNRVVSIGELPYLDPKSTGRAEALEKLARLPRQKKISS